MIEVYCDGACSQRRNSGHGPGGWAVKAKIDKQWVTTAGYEPDTTNNRMELQAAIEGLKYLGDQSQKVTLYSDSAYLINCFKDGWYKKWQRNGWQTQSGNVLNRDLWETLLALTEKHDVTFIKVKGHATNEHNNECDRLAVAQIIANTKLR